MNVSDFNFDLPDQLIAHYPPENRRDSRLLCLDKHSGAVAHRQFTDLLSMVAPDDLLVFNNTRVIPARFFGRKESGGNIEVMLERVLGDNRVVAQIRASKSPGPGTTLIFDLPDGSDITAKVIDRDKGFFHLDFQGGQSVLELIDQIGHMPLPPYIKREDEQLDKERYQTVFSVKPGAVAAPTAGLHFDDAMLMALKDKGVDSAFVTLHVGAGTFQPVRTDTIEAHQMHSEYLEVNDTVCEKVKLCKERGGRVIAIGTTSVRSLETASRGGVIKPFAGDTSIFIYPGYTFKTVDAMLTNFHLPESTLIMLVSAFAGKENVLSAYAEAVKEKYRFFSYGDAMFIA